MTLNELRNHVGNVFRMLKTQAETISLLNENIERTQHFGATSAQAAEKMILALRDRVEILEARVHALESTQPPKGKLN